MSRPMNRAHLWLIGGLLLLVMPLTAWADNPGGTMVLWAQALHMLFGNLIIGYGEGWLLARVFHLKKKSCCVLMILANYFSTWIAWFLIMEGMPRYYMWIDLANVRMVLWAMVSAAYVVLLVLEYPFVALCFWKAEHWFKKSVKASILIQTLSFLLLCGWYSLSCDFSMVNKLRLVDKSELSLPAQTILYFVDEENRFCYAQLPNGSPVKIGQPTPVMQQPDPFLILGKSKQYPGRCALMCGDWNDLRSRASVVEDACSLDSTNVGKTKSPQLSATRQEAVDELPGFKYDPLIMGPEADRSWTFVNRNAAGFFGSDNKTGEFVHFGIESPLILWHVLHKNHLPGDVAVFQLGWDQIYALDLPTRRIALLAKGSSPVVVLDGTPPPAPAAGAPLPVISLGKGGEE